MPRLKGDAKNPVYGALMTVEGAAEVVFRSPLNIKEEFRRLSTGAFWMPIILIPIVWVQGKFMSGFDSLLIETVTLVVVLLVAAGLVYFASRIVNYIESRLTYG